MARQSKKKTTLGDSVPAVADSPPWECALGLAPCSSAAYHARHADPSALLAGPKPLDREVLTLWAKDSSEADYDLLLRRADLPGDYRLLLVARATTDYEWLTVLETQHSLAELRLLAGRLAPSLDALRLLLTTLGADQRGVVRQILAQQEARLAPTPYYNFVFRPEPVAPALLQQTVEELNGPFGRVALAVQLLPCPSGRWTEGLLLGTTRKLFSRISASESQESVDILVSLALNWTGSIAELVEASALLVS